MKERYMLDEVILEMLADVLRKDFHQLEQNLNSKIMKARLEFFRQVDEARENHDRQQLAIQTIISGMVEKPLDYENDPVISELWSKVNELDNIFYMSFSLHISLSRGGYFKGFRMYGMGADFVPTVLKSLTYLSGLKLFLGCQKTDKGYQLALSGFLSDDEQEQIFKAFEKATKELGIK